MTATWHIGDTRTVLRTLPDASVDLALTSSPFYGLRSYLPHDHVDKPLEMGSEASPAEFLDGMLDVVEELRRVLAPHGSMAWELGDTYAGSGGAGGDYGDEGLRSGQPKFKQGKADMPPDKSLMMIPESFRWALAYGRNPFTGRTIEPWRVRNVVRWCRPNPPVGALADKFRPATSDMVIACISRSRYFDLDAVRDGNYEPRGSMGKVDSRDVARAAVGLSSGQPGKDNNPAGAPPLDWWRIPTQPYRGSHYATWPEDLCITPIQAMCPLRVCTVCGEPSRRYGNTSQGRQVELAAHIKARRESLGITSAEVNGWFGYKEIAKNWERTDPFGAAVPSAKDWPLLRDRLGLDPDFDAFVLSRGAGHIAYVTDDGTELAPDERRQAYDRGGVPTDGTRTKASRSAPDQWTDCGHDAWRPGIVLDPFAGSGTTLAVAIGHGRHAIGIDLDPRNYDLARERVGMFLTLAESSAA